MTQRFYGQIKTVNADRGYAHFRADHGVDVFAHFKIFEHAGLATPPKIGERYSFDIEENSRGLRATNIAGAE